MLKHFSGHYHPVIILFCNYARIRSYSKNVVSRIIMASSFQKIKLTLPGTELSALRCSYHLSRSMHKGFLSTLLHMYKNVVTNERDVVHIHVHSVLGELNQDSNCDFKFNSTRNSESFNKMCIGMAFCYFWLQSLYAVSH